MANDDPVAGFQFSLSFNPDIASIVSVSETARTAGFSISQAGSTIIGFSLTGATIAPGDGAIVNVEVSGDAFGAAEACLSDIVLSDSDANSIIATTSCGTLAVGGDIVEGCTDPASLNFNPEANVDDGSCIYPADVTLTFGTQTDNTIDIVMSNEVPVAGFQFTLDGLTVVNASGGSADAAGFTMSSSGGTVIGFSLTGSTIPVGNGVLLTLEHSGFEEVCFDGVVISDTSGSALSVNTGDCAESNPVDPVYGCTDDLACNYDSEANTDDGSCEYPEENYDCDGNCIADVDCLGECGGDAIVDACGDCDGGIDNADDCYTLQYFTDLPVSTGESQLLIISDATGLEPGDEVGLYDASGITNYGDCSDETGELLVGAGVWTGSQLNIVSVGSVDLCAFGGVQLAGYVEGNPVVYKVWKASEDRVYDAEVNSYSAGTGTWGDIIIAADMLEPIFTVTQEVQVSALSMNSISFMSTPEDPAVSSVFSDNDVLIASTDGGQYFAPNFGVDLIGDMDFTRGCNVFLTGTEDQTVVLEGYPFDLEQTPVTIAALQNNLIGYLPMECMPTEYIFEGYDNILIVKDDSGNYYAPSFGVALLDEMCPGEGYEIFLTGTEDVELFYPSSGDMARTNSELSEYWSDYKLNSVSTQYEIARTGISHPIIITELNGSVDIGDELVAYAGEMVVGATKVVDLDAPVVISAWGGYHQYGADLDGYTLGDKIDLRLWSNSEGRELRVVADLDNDEFGVAPLTAGTATVSMQGAIPTEVNLSQNYPNPFNPTTRIDYSVVSDGHVTLNVYDITGRLISTLVDGYVDSGYHSVMWNGSDDNGVKLSSGIYFYTLQGESSTMTRKMVYMK